MKQMFTILHLDPVTEVDLVTLLQEDGGHPNVLKLVDAYPASSTQRMHKSVWEYAPAGDMFNLLQAREKQVPFHKLLLFCLWHHIHLKCPLC